MSTLKHAIVSIMLVALFAFAAHAGSTSDMQAVMKKMGHSYKLAVKATDKRTMLAALDEFEKYLQQAEQGQFKKSEKESREGLGKVAERIQIARELAQSNQLDEAKAQLLPIDDLRKEYHKLHEPPGFWELLFGK
ncbi:cytochrome b562 [Pseudoalteromonas sp. SSDWG2]|uniref:cytochrome b562 n=1 Tax=Pseudoalteromonas sp. SSDWG2 TaxID=3139391 RepID=UPI003BAC67F9